MMSKIMAAENESNDQMSTTTTLLPRDIIIDILSRLPANSLVTSFKLVCKDWHTLIKDPHFVKMHLDRGGGGAIHGGSNTLICKSGKELFQLHSPFNFEGCLVPPPTTIAASTTTTTTKLDLDFGGSLSLRSRSRLVGSCNGLLCINTKNDKSIILLNPSTRRFKVSPMQPIERHSEFHQYGAVVYGFGCCYNYIDNIDEYKVVRIVNSMGRVNGIYSNRSQFDIYSMSSNSWRRDDSKETEFRDYDFSTQPSVFSNGALHWVGADFNFFRTTSCWERIVSFVIKDEEFRKIPIPLSCEPTEDDSYSHLNDMILMNMRGCLTMIRFTNESNDIDVDLEIWVMKEYGIRESWTGEFVIRSSVSDPPRGLSDFVISCISNAYVLKGDQILIQGRKDTSPFEGECRKLVLYGINERKIDEDLKMIGVPDSPNVHQVDYIETLVSLKS